MIKQKYIAEVTNNTDPSKLGRIKVKCPGLVRSDRELPYWLLPNFPYADTGKVGWFSVPSVGAQVEIEINYTGKGDERAGESSLMAPDARYTARVYNDVQPIPDEFRENYPYRRGMKTPSGHLLLFDDSDGNETIRIVDANGNVCVMDSSGVRITDKDGHYVEWHATGIEIDGAVAVARHDDAVIAAPGMITWMAQVAALCNAIVPGSVAPPSPLDFGKVVASSVKVKAG